MARKTAQKTHPRIQINLLRPQGKSERIDLRFLHWLLSYGRFILILVEIVVLATFAMRFKLDEDLANLKQNVNSKVENIQGYKNDELRFKQIQFKLSTAKSAYSSNSDWVSFFKLISKQIPIDTKLVSLSLEPTENGMVNFKFSATSNNPGDLAGFINGLKNEKDFSDLTITSISYDQGELTFSITGGYK